MHVILFCERTITMNNHIKSDWLAFIQQRPSTAGHFLGKDKVGRKIVIEWMKTKMASLEFAAAMRSVSEIGVQAFTSVEMQILRAFPSTSRPR